MVQSLVTHKSLFQSHFSEILKRACNMGLEIKKGKLNSLCYVEWPKFGVGWPPEGSYSQDLVSKIKAVITRPGRAGHLDQKPHIVAGFSRGPS